MSIKTHVIPWISSAAARSSKVSLRELQISIERIQKQLVPDNSTRTKFTNHSSIPSAIHLLSYKKGLIKDLPEFKPIEKFTFDGKKYQVTSTEMKNAKSEFKESKYTLIKNNEPICRDYKLLKGPNSDLYTIAFLKGISKQKSIHKCKWFTFNYWHSNSYLGKVIKSRPGIMIICHNTHMFNKNATISGSIPSSIQNTSYPFKFSVNRSRIRKLVRKHFLTLYLKNESYAEKFDGLYRFSCYQFPESLSEVRDLVANIKICLEKVSKLDENHFKKSAMVDDSKVPWREVNRILLRNEITDSRLTIPTKRKSSFKNFT